MSSEMLGVRQDSSSGIILITTCHWAWVLCVGIGDNGGRTVAAIASMYKWLRNASCVQQNSSRGGILITPCHEWEYG